MALYRAKQFFLSLYTIISDEDIKFIDNYLDSFEKNLFFQLRKSEQKHSLRVAAMILKICEESKSNLDKFTLIKAGLLHDIGKGKRINTLQKVIVVLANKLFGNKVKKINSVDFINVYYNHAEYGYNMLKEYECNQKLMFLIRNHHSNSIDEKELNILKNCDDSN